jgi:hypothetical protein
MPDGARCLLSRGSRQAIFVRKHSQIQLFTSKFSSYSIGTIGVGSAEGSAAS